MRNLINIIEASTKSGKEITFTRKENVDRENRGWIIDQVEAYIDGENVGYLKIENIPKEKWKKYYPSIFNYMDQINGVSLFPMDKETVDYKTLTDDELHTLLDHLVQYRYFNTELPENMSRYDVLRMLQIIKTKLMKKDVGKQFIRFRDYTVDRPMIAYIISFIQRERIGAALYIEGAKWMAERGLRLYASGVQTNEAKAVWEFMETQGWVVHGKLGKYIGKAAPLTEMHEPWMDHGDENPEYDN